MKSRKPLYAGAALVVVVIAVGIGLWVQKKKSVPPPPPADAQSMEQIIESLRKQNANPAKSSYAGKDFKSLQDKINAQDATTPNVLQAGIVFFDLHDDASWTEEDAEKFALILLQSLKSEKEMKARRARLLTLQLLKRVLPKQKSPEVSKIINTHIKDSGKDLVELSQFLEIASLCEPVPALFRSKLEGCIQSADLGVAQACLTTSEQIRDEATKKSEMTFLVKKVKSLRAPLQPFAARVVITAHKGFEKEARALLVTASKETSDVWCDVFLYGVTELGEVAKYRSQLSKIATTSESPIIRQRAQSLLQ